MSEDLVKTASDFIVSMKGWNLPSKESERAFDKLVYAVQQWYETNPEVYQKHYK